MDLTLTPSLRTVSPPPTRTIWTITAVTPTRNPRVFVVDGTKCRRDAIASVMTRVTPGEVVIATHSAIPQGRHTPTTMPHAERAR